MLEYSRGEGGPAVVGGQLGTELGKVVGTLLEKDGLGDGGN